MDLESEATALRLSILESLDSGAELTSYVRNLLALLLCHLKKLRTHVTYLFDEQCIHASVHVLEYISMLTLSIGIDQHAYSPSPVSGPIDDEDVQDVDEKSQRSAVHNLMELLLRGQLAPEQQLVCIRVCTRPLRSRVGTPASLHAYMYSFTSHRAGLLHYYSGHDREPRGAAAPETSVDTWVEPD